MKPTSMLYRNFLAMETEELLRQHPIDGAVLMGGCDKTTPAPSWAASRMNLPMIFMPAGPMMRGHFARQHSGLRLRRLEILGREGGRQHYRQQWNDMEAGIARSPGTLHDDGHGLDDDDYRGGARASRCRARPRFPPPIPRIRAWPRCAGAASSRWSGRTSSRATSSRRKSVENALIVHSAIGGSTNAMVHLVAMARRAGVPIDLKDFDEFAARVPVILNLRPSGKWLMEDLYYRRRHARALLAAEIHAASRRAHGRRRYDGETRSATRRSTTTTSFAR